MRRSRLWLVGLGMFLACRAQDKKDTIESLTFYPITLQGEHTDAEVIALQDSEGMDHASACTLGVCRNLPSGRYQFTLRLPINGRIEEGMRNLSNRREWITVDLGPGIGTAGDFAPPPPLRGRVTGRLERTGDPVWVRIKPLYATGEAGSKETPVADDGTFQFNSVYFRKWLVLVFQGPHLLYSGAPEVRDVRDELVIELR